MTRSKRPFAREQLGITGVSRHREARGFGGCSPLSIHPVKRAATRGVETLLYQAELHTHMLIGCDETRTRDHVVPTAFAAKNKLADRAGIEPAASGLTDRHSFRLSYLSAKSTATKGKRPFFRVLLLNYAPADFRGGGSCTRVSSVTRM